MRAQTPRDPFSVLDVPFIAQSEDLCGGAAAAMVLRYWGVTDVQAEDFSPLVDHARGGISVRDLTSALSSRGLPSSSLAEDGSGIESSIAAGRPAIVLIDGGHGRLHYVVVVAWSRGHVLYHDPSAGPFRMTTEAAFREMRKPGNGWAIAPSPETAPSVADARSSTSDSPAPSSAVGLASPPRLPSACDVVLEPWIAVARGGAPEDAVEPLRSAAALCPTDGRPLAAIAGVRFRQQRWKESIDAARAAIARDPSDRETWRLLGAAFFLDDDPKPALRSWNEIHEPALDLIQIDGLVRTRQEIATKALRLHPRDIVTPESLARAERRIEALPTTTGARVTYRPVEGGRANAIVSAGEGPLIEKWPILLGRIGVEAVAKRETRIRVNSPMSRGEAFDLFGRYAKNRPAAWSSLEVPEFAGLPGVVTIKGAWDRQTYGPESIGGEGVRIQTRRRGAVEWSHWLRSSLRAEASTSFERFEREGDYLTIRAGLDIRAAGDRLALFGDAARWSATSTRRRGFTETGATLAFRSALEPRRFGVQGRFDVRRAGDDAPLAIWPGAGTGPGRPWLMRSAKLIEEGIVVGPAFGRRLLHGSVEGEVTLRKLALASVGVAAFSDWARVSHTAFQAGAEPSLFAVGVGLRIRSGVAGAFRLDLARRPGHAGTVFSSGVILPWPR